MTVTILNVNEAPVFTSYTPGVQAQISAEENTTSLTTIAASDEDGDTFDFDDMDPDDIDNMTGVEVTIVIESYSPEEVEKGEIIRITGYAEDENGTKLLDFPIGFGMWDKDRVNPAFEIGSTVTSDTGTFDYNSTDFLAALPGINEIIGLPFCKSYIFINTDLETDSLFLKFKTCSSSGCPI